jgi:hypothetical protein
MDTQSLIRAERIQGEDEEETTMLREMLANARRYIRSYSWCPAISEEYMGFGISNIFALFLFRFAQSIDDTDDYLWVVEGDLPSAYFVVDEARNPRAAAQVYCGMMEEWIDAVQKRSPLDNVFPIKADATTEIAQMLTSRIRYIRSEIIPMIPS